MGFLSLNDSGTSIARAWGSDMPAITKYSSTLSRLAESLMAGCTIGVRSRPRKAGEERSDSRAVIQRRLP